MIRLQAFERCLERRPDIARSTPRLDPLPHVVVELRREHDPVTAPAEQLP